MRPKVLGVLLDAVSTGLRNLDGVKPEKLPRMADFAVWVTAAEEALGWESGAFMDAYSGNRSAATELALDDDPVAVAVRRLINKEEEWSGTSTELLSRLGNLVDEETKRSKSWPAAANALSNRLKRLAPALREVGIEYKDGRESGGSRTRKKSLKKKPAKDRPDCPDSPAEPESPANPRDDLETVCDDAGCSRDNALAKSVPDKSAANGHVRDGRDSRDDKKHSVSIVERERFTI